MSSTRTCLTRISGTTALVSAMITSWILLPAMVLIPETIAPYLLLIGIILIARTRNESAWAALAGTLIVSGIGLYILIDAIYIHPDPQAGLAVLVIPWLQWVGCGLTTAPCLAVVFLKWLVWPQRRTA